MFCCRNVVGIKRGFHAVADKHGNNAAMPCASESMGLEEMIENVNS